MYKRLDNGHVASTIISVLTTVVLVGCSAPGTPSFRVAANDVEGPLIAGCKNVLSSYRVGNYITTSYLSTWGSAWLEGAPQGLSEGFQDTTSDVKITTKTVGRVAGLRVLARMAQATSNLTFSPEPFCRAYVAQFHEVARAVKEVISLLGNRVTVSDEENGYFDTDFVNRRHPAAQWRDRYIIGLESEAPEKTIVRIVRVLYISRDGERFNQAVSVGHNEAWILTRVADKMRSN